MSLRIALICAVLLFGVVVGYAYFRDPAGCEKVLNDAGSVVTSLSPFSQHPDAASQISTLIQGKLISADGSPFDFPANAPVTSIRYYAIYYSAQWCPPCHAFTPVLVQWYKTFKPSHPNFELIFVSEDHDEASMLDYMREMAMPWPAVRFGDLKHDGGFKGSDIEKFAGSGIPDLVLVDAGGNVLSDSFTWTGSYLGPMHVLDDIKKLVPTAAPGPPVQATEPASVAASASPVPTPPPSPTKPWAPSDVMPSQPNWTWTTLDGKTYRNVVVTEIKPDTVTINHLLGVARIPIYLLPPDIQKQLNYDPVVAAAARAEIQRELAHPYYTMASLAEAQGVARQMHWPLAWISSRKEDIASPNPVQDDETELTVMALDHLKDKSIIIFIDATSEMGQTPAIVHHQFSQFDDGALAGGANYMPPKVVFSTPDASKILGRVSYTQMKASGALAIDEVLDSIPKDSDAQPLSNGQTVSAPAPPSSLPTVAPVPVTSQPPPVTAAVPPASAPVATPSPDATKPWAPPDVMPSQPNWTWTTADGKTYQNVVVTKIEPDTVTINHSLGVAHIPINLLPPDIQKQLNYDPHAASQAPP